MTTKKPKLPPLQRYQMDVLTPGNAWEQSPPSFFSVRAAQEYSRVQNYPAGTLLVIRVFVNGKVAWRNEEAKKAGL